MSKKVTLIPSWYKRGVCDGQKRCDAFCTIAVSKGTVSSCDLIEAGKSCKEVKNND